MTKRNTDFTLTKLDDLFTTQEQRDDAKLERVQNIPLCELHPFKDHPFKAQNDEEMKRMIESIKKVGAITPAVARPINGGYEIISGHRRLAAYQELGLETMPVIVRDMTDDEAVIAMVDANLQRETVLPSEKAFAFKMKRDALNHQGITSPQVGEKLLTVEKIGVDSGDSKNQVLRYIRLTYLIPELLSMVDDNKIAFNPAVEISYLNRDEQFTLLDAMDLNDCTPSHSQSMRTLPLVGSFAEYFKEVKAAQEINKKVCGNCYNYEYDGYVFVDELGNLMNPNYLTSQFPQYIQKHGCKRMRFHDLRHSCASLLLANGVPLKQIQEWLGHSDFSTTANIYAHLDYSSKLSSASAMVSGMALPKTANFGNKWSENSYENGKNRA